MNLFTDLIFYSSPTMQNDLLAYNDIFDTSEMEFANCHLLNRIETAAYSYYKNLININFYEDFITVSRGDESFKVSDLNNIRYKFNIFVSIRLFILGYKPIVITHKNSRMLLYLRSEGFNYLKKYIEDRVK